MSGSQLSVNDVDVDLRRLFASLARNWPRILFWSLTIAGLALILALVATPKYLGETRLSIEPRESVFTQPDNRSRQSPNFDEEAVATQVEIISSTDILTQVGKKLNLSRFPEFDEAADISALDRVLILAGLKTDPNDIPAEERVLKRMREKLAVYRIEKSRVITIQFSSEDPGRAAEIPNAIADAYIALSRDAKRDSNTDATAWLQPAIDDLTKQVEEAELGAVEREANVQRDLLQSDLARSRETSSRGELIYLPVDARVFSPAFVPSAPYFPKIVPIAGAAFVGSLLILSLITLVAELFSGRAMRAAQGARVEPVTQVPLSTAAAALARAEAMASRPATAFVDLTKPPQRSGELAVASAVERLIATGTRRVIFISPQGDESSAASVLVARDLSDNGLRVVLLDLTQFGAPSAAMLESAFFSGITNLLSAEAQFAEVIHADHYSDCHIIPVGTADPERAMRAVDRLPIILDSLASAYDVIVVECGPAPAEEIKRLVGQGATLVVSANDPTDSAVMSSVADLREAGHVDVMIVRLEDGYAPPIPAPGRTAA